MSARSTIEDVAREAGVSLMTVSRAVNGRPGVGEATRRRVLDIAARLGYRPDRRASALASKSSKALGLVLPDMANPFFAILAKAATDLARAEDLNVFVMNTDEDPERELSAYLSLLEERIDGVLVAASRLSPRRLRAAVTHFASPILVNSQVRGPGIGNVDVDDRGGMLEAVKHLVGSGRRTIAFAAGPKTSVSAGRRLEGYRAGLLEGGLRAGEELVLRVVPDIEGGRRAVHDLLEAEPSIDAILAHNDITAIGVMRGLAEAGRRIPDDVAVLGVDDIPFAALVRPSLSTVRVDIAELGRRAMALLLARREGRELEPSAPLATTLVLRESCP